MTTLRNPPSTDIAARLRALLGVEAGEETTVTLMVTLYFIVSIAFVLVQTTAFGLFVNEFGSQSLPFAYLSVAVLGSLVGFLYLKLSDQLRFRSAQFANLGFLAGMCLVFWIGLGASFAHWVIFLLPFWFQALVNQSNLIVWHLAGHLFNVRQAKRLYGLVGAGNWLANIIGGAVVAAILAATGTANAYLLAGLAMVIASPVLFLAMKPLEETAPRTGAQQPAGASGTMVSPFRHPYSRLIFAYTLLWWLGFFFVDMIFFDRAGIEFPSGTELATFLARQLSVMGVIAIITTMFLTSRIVRTYGLRTGLLAMPLVVTASILLLALGGSLGWSLPALFWIAAVAKTFNVALGFSISQVTGSLLFQPLFGRQRNAAQTIAEGIVQPVATGLAGVILLLFTTILHFNAVGLSYLFLFIAVMWLWVMIRLSQEYPLVMSEALHKRSLGETTSLVFDPSALAQLRSSLRNPHAGLAIYALNQLEQLAPETWAATLRDELHDLMLHPVPEVRREALLRVLALRLAAAIPDVRSRLTVESDGQVRAAMIQVLAALEDRASSAQISEALDSSDRMVKRGAILGLLASGGAEDARRAEAALGVLVGSRESSDRLLAAEILGESATPGAGGRLVALLDDRDVAVRRAAIRSCGRHDDARLIPALLEACQSPETVIVAEQVLVSKGAQVIDPIADEFGADDAHPVGAGRVQSMARVLGKIPGARSSALLAGKISIADPQARLQVLRSLSAIGFRAASSNQIMVQVRNEVTLACRLAEAIEAVRDANDDRHLGMLGSALRIAFGEARERTLLLLSFVLHAQAILRARSAIEAAGGGSSPVALETVDALLPAGIKPFILPLLEDISEAERLKRWEAAGLEIARLPLSAVLRSLIGTEDETEYNPWTRMCAMYAAAVLDAKSCAPVLQSRLTGTEPALRAMTSWSLARLSRDRIAEGVGNMLSIVEKVLIMKSSPLFSETPDNVLADIADLVDEIAVEKDQVIFNRGDPGDSLYIVVSGAVQVWENDRLLNSLGEGDLFGELALLDPEPRLATVKTTESTRLLRLDQAHFHEVLAVRPEVSFAIIRVVTRYLRGQLKYAREVNEKLRSLESFGALSNPSRD